MSSKNRVTSNNKNSWIDKSSKLENWALKSQTLMQDQLNDPFYQEANIEMTSELEQLLKD